MKRISVIVPMYNEARHIVRTLDSVSSAAAVAGLECELIVVDNGSRDNGPQLAMDQGARVLHYPGLSIGALRNRGAACATGDWLAFLDADIEVPLNWLLLWKSAEASQRADVFALDCDAPRSAPWFARAWQRRSLSGNQQERLLQWLPTPNLCMARVWFNRIGGFDEGLRTGEDKDFGLRLNRAGARQLSLATPVVQHWGFEGSWREWSGKEFWRQSSHVQLLRNGGLSPRLLRFPCCAWPPPCSACWPCSACSAGNGRRRCWPCSAAPWRPWAWPCARATGTATRCFSCNSGCCTGCACTWAPLPCCRAFSTVLP